MSTARGANRRGEGKPETEKKMKAVSGTIANTRRALYTSISGRRAIHAMPCNNSRSRSRCRHNNNNDRNKGGRRRERGGLARFELVSDGMTVILLTLSSYSSFFLFFLFHLKPDNGLFLHLKSQRRAYHCCFLPRMKSRRPLPTICKKNTRRYKLQAFTYRLSQLAVVAVAYIHVR